MIVNLTVLAVIFVVVNTNAVSDRSSKFFPFYSVVRFENSICIGTCKLTGTCYTRRECKAYGGMGSGTCAKRLGVCCIVQKSCGGSSHINNTYFQNPGYPSPHDGGSRCSFSITRCDPNVCQLRLDFLSLDLAQPNGDGQCINDAFTVTGGASRAPMICGDNTGQHMYIDFDGDSPINLAVKVSTLISKSRTWNIKATQIACDCPTKAPSGCLQYYMERTGTVQSFNYDSVANTNPPAANMAVPGTREMANLRYGICIEMAPNYCGIQWSSGDMYSFTLTGDAVTDPNVGMPAGESVTCMNDYVIIPNPIDPVSMMSVSDRFCGVGFATKTSYTKPFVLYVVSDADESNGDVGNRGFSLDYKQVPCTD